jgi:hypothetical protein
MALIAREPTEAVEIIGLTAKIKITASNAREAGHDRIRLKTP